MENFERHSIITSKIQTITTIRKWNRSAMKLIFIPVAKWNLIRLPVIARGGGGRIELIIDSGMFDYACLLVCARWLRNVKLNNRIIASQLLLAAFSVFAPFVSRDGSGKQRDYDEFVTILVESLAETSAVA